MSSMRSSKRLHGLMGAWILVVGMWHCNLAYAVGGYSGEVRQRLLHNDELTFGKHPSVKILGRTIEFNTKAPIAEKLMKLRKIDRLLTDEEDNPEAHRISAVVKLLQEEEGSVGGVRDWTKEAEDWVEKTSDFKSKMRARLLAVAADWEERRNERASAAPLELLSSLVYGCVLEGGELVLLVAVEGGGGGKEKKGLGEALARLLAGHKDECPLTVADMVDAMAFSRRAYDEEQHHNPFTKTKRVPASYSHFIDHLCQARDRRSMMMLAYTLVALEKGEAEETSKDRNVLYVDTNFFEYARVLANWASNKKPKQPPHR